MDKLRLLIADDNEDNRLVLRATCRNLEYFDIKDAVDGIEAVEITESWLPHIILMDIMMPGMDGFEASKIIKEKYPQTVIMAVTGVHDSRVEEKMSSIGIDIYIHKPIDRELIRFKLQSVASSFHLKLGNFKERTKRKILNPFNSDIPSYKTIFDIVDAEAMMEFGMWLFDRYNGKYMAVLSKFDKVIELFYKLMSQGSKSGEKMTIIVEESYEEFYITMKFERTVILGHGILDMLNEFGTEVVYKDNVFCARLGKPIEREQTPQDIQAKAVVSENIKIQDTQEQTTQTNAKEIRVIESQERALLHQSFVHKTSAADYVEEIGDVLDEVLELSSMSDEWRERLDVIEKEPNEQSLREFVDMVLNIYVHTINNLFEFTALAYALTSLGVFIKENAAAICEDASKTKKLIMLLEHLGEDLTAWREHIFVLQDTEDIHYLDSSFFSSCMQIEGIVGDKELSGSDDNDMEFF